MKLRRLVLESWRGVGNLAIDFSNEVTLIEGPNEVGKSTIVEAIYMLFKTMDSSSKQDVKAIMPIGEDVGSRIEAEIESGEYHFIYEKTYNKSKQTKLRILSPKAEQLNGREAHERAENILAETIDVALWEALLVEQGIEIGGAHLADSAGLVRALDAAAGTASTAVDDSALFEAIQREYEQFFTPGRGTARGAYANMERDLVAQRVVVAAATKALEEIETDSNELDLAIKEVSRLEAAVPDLASKVTEHEGAWKTVEALSDRVTTKAGERDAALELSTGALADQERRARLKSQIKEVEGQVKALQDELASGESELTIRQQEMSQASVALRTATEQQLRRREDERLASADEAHLRNVNALAAVEKKLAQLAILNMELGNARNTLADIRIDPNKLEELRVCEHDLQVAIARRDASALNMEVTAYNELQFTINGEPVALSAGGRTDRKITAALVLEFTDVASVQVSPSESLVDLESTVESKRAALLGQLNQAGVRDLADAIVTERRRVDAAQVESQCNDKIAHLLDGESEANLRSAHEDLGRKVEQYLQSRSEEGPLPDSLSRAEAESLEARSQLTSVESKIEALREQELLARENLEKYRADLSIKQEELRGRQRTSEELQSQLAEAVAEESDAELVARVDDRRNKYSSLKAELDELQSKLDSASPETTKSLLANAQDAHHRALDDLQSAKQNQAVLQDRLNKAQADGRFETLTNAELKLEALEAEFAATERRANAAKLLWETINTHRDAARKAYVKPLKDGIEQLGGMVFGSGFSVELDDQWNLVSRTLNGKTIAFGHLSVGAREQLGILTRLAAARIVAIEGGVPVIIDDALGFSDPARLETMGAAIASASKNCQVILLSCTPGRFMHVGNAKVVKIG